MDPDNLVSINLNSNQKFLDGEVIRASAQAKSQNGNKSIVESVVNGHYDFSWGKIIEQLAGNFFIWGFRFSTLTNKSDGELYEIYQKIFKHLHKQFPDHSSEHAILVAGLHDWCVYPGHGEDAIIIATPFQAEYKSRIWVHSKVLLEEVPELLSTIITP